MLAAVAAAALLLGQAPPADPAAPAPAAQNGEVIPPARLVYLPGRFVHQCPTEVEVQDGVRRRLGRSPFAEPPERMVVLALEGEGEAPSIARTELFSTSFESLGARTLESTEGCTELVEAAALAISIALAPSLALGVPPPPPVETPPPPVPVPEPVVEPLEPEERPTAPSESPPATPPWVSWLPDGSIFLVGAGTSWSLLFGPDASPGGQLSVAARIGTYEVGLEQRQLLPQWSDAELFLHGGSVNTVSGCGHAELFGIRGDGDKLGLYGCGTFSFGNIWAIGGDADGPDGFYSGGGGYVGAGGRTGLTWRQADFSSVRLWTQLEWSLLKPELYVFGQAPRFSQGAPVTLTMGVSYELSWPP